MIWSLRYFAIVFPFPTLARNASGSKEILGVFSTFAMSLFHAAIMTPHTTAGAGGARIGNAASYVRYLTLRTAKRVINSARTAGAEARLIAIAAAFGAQT